MVPLYSVTLSFILSVHAGGVHMQLMCFSFSTYIHLRAEHNAK